MPRLSYVEGTSSKFWEGSVSGSVLTVKFGRIGTAGQTKDKDMGSPAAAQKELDKLIREKTREGYVAESVTPATGTGDPTTTETMETTVGENGRPEEKTGVSVPAPTKALDRAAVPKPTAPAVGDGKYPFLFYGARPGDWAGFVYALRFVNPPDAATRLAIAGAWEKAARRTSIDTDWGGDWRWGANWVLLSVDARGSDWDFFYAEIERCLRAIHAVAFLVEVIDSAATAPSDSDEWTNWTLGIQPVPSPQPAWKGLATISCWRERLDPTLGEGETDFAVEQARQEVRKYGKAARPVPKGALEIKEIDSVGAPLPPMVPREAMQLFPERSYVQGQDAARVAASFCGTMLYLDREGKLAAVPDHGETTAYRGFRISPDGAHAVVEWYPDGTDEWTCVYQLSLPGGEFRQVLRFPGHLQVGVDYLGNDRLAVRVRDRVVLAGLDGTRHAVTRPIEGVGGVRSGPDGRLLFLDVKRPDGKNATRVLRVDGDVLSEVCDLPVTFEEVWAADGRLLAGEPARAGIGTRFVEILHADEVLASPPAGSSLMDISEAMKSLDEPDPTWNWETGKQAPAIPGQLDLVLVRQKWNVLPEPVPEGIRQKFGETIWLTSRAGRYVGVTRDWKLLYTDANGEVKTAEEGGDPRAPWIDPDGRRALLTATFTDAVRVYEMNLDDGTCKQLRQWDFRDYRARVVGVGEDMMAAVAGEWLLLESRIEDKQLANLKFRIGDAHLEGTLLSARYGRLLFVRTDDWRQPTQVFRVDGHKLKKLDPLTLGFDNLWERDGHVYVGNLPWGYVYEMTGVDEVLSPEAGETTKN